MRSQAGILATAAVALLATAAALLGLPTAVMVAVGLPLIASPGYVWGRVLLGSAAAGLERVAVSAALSLAVPVLGGLALYAAGVSLSRLSWTCLIAGVTLAGDVVLAVRHRAPAAPGGERPRSGRRLPLRHILPFTAAVAIAAAGMSLAASGARWQRHPGFTQLWVVPQGGAAHTADIGVSNHQHTTTRYRLEVLRRGHTPVTRTLTLTTGQTWHVVVGFGGSPTIAANLYLLPDLTHPYRHVVTNDSRAP